MSTRHQRKAGAIKIDIQTVQKGDIVRFASYALRVESVPERSANSITLYGRTSTDGSPLVTKRFIGPRIVDVERIANELGV